MQQYPIKRSRHFSTDFTYVININNIINKKRATTNSRPCKITKLQNNNYLKNYFSNLNHSKSKLLPGRNANATFCLPLMPERSKLF